MSGGSAEGWFWKQLRKKKRPEGVCPSCLKCAKGQVWGAQFCVQGAYKGAWSENKKPAALAAKMDGKSKKG